ncbi:Serine/threonine protein kinase [Phytophthora palmivora]|uniref:Serine/threonine protein kinase n=1 Tax=Phytophthora palmivora TaxID=4796 RepID=A0A2P4WYG9_9STRA|nr:Serine/threonine protein kinase [Phytophthora palmivora]
MSSTCTRNETALTSECNSLCSKGRPCVAYAAGDEAKCSNVASMFGNCTADDYCTYECFVNGPDDFVANGAIDFSTYTFFIPFSSEVGSSEQETEVDAELTAVTNMTTEYPSKANGALQHIEPLSFMTSTIGVVLAGGSSVFGVRGKVAKVQLPQKLLTANTQLQTVTLANLGLEQILASSLPSGLVNLTISNCLMTSYPDDLKAMTELENLYDLFI